MRRRAQSVCEYDAVVLVDSAGSISVHFAPRLEYLLPSPATDKICQNLYYGLAVVDIG
jgi:hypothetical protein